MDTPTVAVNPNGLEFSRDMITELHRALLETVVEMEVLRRKECLTEDEAAKLYSLPAASLRTDRYLGRGPRFIRPSA